MHKSITNWVVLICSIWIDFISQNNGRFEKRIDLNLKPGATQSYMEVLLSANKRSFTGTAIGLVICLLPISIPAQSHRIDSLKKAIRQANTAVQKLSSTLELCKEKNSLSGDTLFVYASIARQLALQLKDNNSLAWADYYLKAYLLANGKIDSVLSLMEANSKITAALKDRNLYYKFQLLKANALNRKNRLNESLAFQLQLLPEAEKDDNVSAQLFILNYLGSTFMNLNDMAGDCLSDMLISLDHLFC